MGNEEMLVGGTRVRSHRHWGESDWAIRAKMPTGARRRLKITVGGPRARTQSHRLWSLQSLGASHTVEHRATEGTGAGELGGQQGGWRCQVSGEEVAAPHLFLERYF